MKKVVIIGAGPAGLTAGYELLKENKEQYEVIILEETEDIGGISKTVKYNGNRMDIGGHRFFSKDDRVMKFWEELMPIQGSNSFDDEELGREKPLVVGGPDPEKEDKVMLLRTRVSRIYYLKKFFDYPISLKLQTFTNMGFIRTVKAGFSYLKTIFVKKEENSLENFYINRFGKVLYSMFFEKYTEKLWGRHPKEIDASWGAQSIFPNSNDIKQLETRDILLGDISDNVRAIYGKSAEINKSYFNQKDNCLKWNTISNIDEDFIQRYLNNGNVIFYLPNKFEYIIEKIFKNSVKPTYGNAVYILNKEDFKKYENDIIDSKTKEINNTLLLKLSNEKNNSIKKVVNTGWSYLIENI